MPKFKWDDTEDQQVLIAIKLITNNFEYPLYSAN